MMRFAQVSGTRVQTATGVGIRVGLFYLSSSSSMLTLRTASVTAAVWLTLFSYPLIPLWW